MPPLRIKLWLGFLRCIDRHITVVDAENADERRGPRKIQYYGSKVHAANTDVIYQRFRNSWFVNEKRKKHRHIEHW